MFASYFRYYIGSKYILLQSPHSDFLFKLQPYAEIHFIWHYFTASGKIRYRWCW